MSHTVIIPAKTREPAAIEAACKRLGYSEPTRGRAKLYASEAEGIVVQLPGWRYPIVVQPETGSIVFDDFGGRWGNRERLDQFLQAYAVEVARADARRHGRIVIEQRLPDGSILLDLQGGE